MLLLIIVMEALSFDFCTSCPFELLYADNLVLVSDSLDDLLEKLHAAGSPGSRPKGYE